MGKSVSYIRARRSKPRPGRVRGKKMAELRKAAWERDGGICQGCFMPCGEDEWHLAHIRGKRNFGDDISNVRVKHIHCHMVIEHNPKPCPPKPELARNGETQQ
jgi:hypothetical protein